MYGETISKLIDERDNLKETLAALESNHREMLDANEAYEKAFASKDAEIMKLKAMLFDMMYKTA